jgi:sugar phosphate isomerase/epimerase
MTHPDRLPLSRREWLRRGGLSLGAAVTASATAAAFAAALRQTAEPFRYCLNTATIRGQKLPLPAVARIAAKAGYQAIEPWVGEIDDYVNQGGSLADLKKQIADLGLSVESSIAFGDWISDEAERSPQGLETCKRDMDRVARIGGKRICAPPSGAKKVADTDLAKIARRYRRLLELGRQFGVVPQVELWSHSKTLHRMSEIAYVVVEANHPDACALLDVIHIYRGSPGFAGVRMFSSQALHTFHINDYPAHSPRETLSDAARVFPGDGIAPLAALLGDLRAIGFRGVLSLELFNHDYWQRDALEVARTGLEKMRAVAATAGSQ